VSAPAGFDELQDLYSKVLRDLARNPQHRGRLESPMATARGDNPMCGDRVEVFLNLDGARISEAMFLGRGCEISQASAALLTELVRGKSPEEARALGQAVARMARSGERDESTDELRRLSVFSVVQKFPSRVKCATLAWHALDAALAGVKETSSE
jgi:nitrogen fixation protein NifU and related proteins